MARIRSVHPGFFDDDAFCELSEAAQIFYIGILTQSDDQGMFEWKPSQLRRKLRSGKDGDVTPLLEELIRGNCIQKAEIGGREYGAVRNFRKYQRPKKPKAVHPITDELRKYVALDTPSSELDDDEAGSGTENVSQMEEEGGRRKDGSSSLRSDYPPEFEAAWQALPKRNGSNDKKTAFEAWSKRRKEGHSAEDILAGAKRYAAWCVATKKVGTEHAMQGKTFFGLADPLHFTAAWEAPGDAGTPAPATEVKPHDLSLAPYMAALVQSLGIPAVNSWLVDCAIEAGEDGWLTLVSPHEWRAGYIENNLKSQLRSAFEAHGKQVQVVFREKAA